MLCDRLVPKGIRDRISSHAKIIEVGKGRGTGMRQEQINTSMIDAARSNRRVVRLKGGDPFVFGRGGEEILALAKAGLPVELVPGVSSSLAGPAMAGIPVTHRGLASSVCILTAEHADGPRSDWSAAVAADTIVLLMGLATLGEVVSALIRAGKDPETASAVVENATLGEQRVIRASLGSLASAAKAAKVRSPALVVVGRTVELSEQLSGALNPTRVKVLVTRAEHQAPALAEALQRHGLEPVVAPAIRIAPSASRTMNSSLRRLAAGNISWVVFTSANGVQVTMAALKKLGLDSRAFGRSRIAAIGPATCNALGVFGLDADLIASKATTRSLIQDFPNGTGEALLLRADLADPTLGKALLRKGYSVSDVSAYKIVAITSWPRSIQDQLSMGDIRFVAFASAETAKATARLLASYEVDSGSLKAICIGPVCAEGAKQAGFDVAQRAATPSIEDLAIAAAKAAALMFE